MIRLFISRHSFLKHITTSGTGRTNRVIITEINRAVRRENASGNHTHTDAIGLRSGGQYQEQQYDDPRRIPVKKSSDTKLVYSFFPTWGPPLEGLIWRCMTRLEVITEMKRELPGHKFLTKDGRSMWKMERIRYWIEHGDPTSNKVFIKNKLIYEDKRRQAWKKDVEKSKTKRNWRQ